MSAFNPYILYTFGFLKQISLLLFKCISSVYFRVNGSFNKTLNHENYGIMIFKAKCSAGSEKHFCIRKNVDIDAVYIHPLYVANIA